MIGIVTLRFFLRALTLVISSAVLVIVLRASANYSSVDEIFWVDNPINNSEEVLLRLKKALNFRTITYGPRNYEREELAGLINFITTSYPLLHSSPLVKLEVINGLSLLYHIKGNDSSLRPFLLSAHLDVVPVEENYWEVPPFSGFLKNGYVYGRGAIDAKDMVMGILESLENLLREGFVPERSFYLAFGHDEEGGGVDGAYYIAKKLLSLGVTLEFILDEGGFVMNKSVPGVDVPVAMIGVTEKGSLNLLLTVAGKTGHSSIPPYETCISVLGKAVSKLRGDAFPSMLGKSIEEEFFQSIAKCANFFFKIIYSNLWMFKPAITWKASYHPEMNALIRTTIAVTKIAGGTKENVLPGEAEAIVNIRVHPAQTIEEVIQYVKHLLSDERVNVTVLSSFPPHPVSSFSKASFGFMAIRKSIKQVFPNSCSVPMTLVGNTDSRWYLNLTDAVYRFSPVNLHPWELSRFHGHNEKIKVTNYVQLINFYFNLIKNANSRDVDWSYGHTHEL